MPDESDPPRKFYGFKPKEFERANEIPAALTNSAPQADPGIVPAATGKIDVNELIRAGAGSGRQLGSNAVRNRENEVHAMLHDNYVTAKVAGQFQVENLDDSKRRRRIRNYWLAMAAMNVPLGFFAWYLGPGDAMPFIFALAGMALFSAKLTWETFFLRTHY
jgi:hypothetical protein